METRKVASRGRIDLGKEFANRTIFFEKIGETEFKLELAAVIYRRGNFGSTRILKPKLHLRSV
jgi:hypothetical protein